MSALTAENLPALFALVRRRVENLQVPSRDIAQVIQASILKNIDKQGRYDPNVSSSNILGGGNSKWKDLAKSTKAQYQKRGWKTNTLLDRSGEMRASITVWAVGNIINIASNKVQARIQNDGGEIRHPGGTPYIVTNKGVRFMRKDGDYPDGVKFTAPHTIVIPSRRYVVLQREDLEDIADLIAGKSLI